MPARTPVCEYEKKCYNSLMKKRIIFKKSYDPIWVETSVGLIKSTHHDQDNYYQRRSEGHQIPLVYITAIIKDPSQVSVQSNKRTRYTAELPQFSPSAVVITSAGTNGDGQEYLALVTSYQTGKN